MSALGGKFFTSVSVLIAVFYVSFSQLHDFNLQLSFGLATKTFTAAKNVLRRNIAEPVLNIRVLKRFIIAVLPKKCTKLSKDGKWTVKRGRAFGSLLK